MTSNDISVANFGPMRVEVRYNRTGAGEGPTVRVFGEYGEFLRADLFERGLQGPHYHINPYTNPKAGETATRVDGITTPPALLEHLLEVETLKALAQLAGEPKVAKYLTPANDAEVKRFISSMVNYVSK